VVVDKVFCSEFYIFVHLLSQLFHQPMLCEKIRHYLLLFVGDITDEYYDQASSSRKENTLQCRVIVNRWRKSVLSTCSVIFDGGTWNPDSDVEIDVNFFVIVLSLVR
jgi:hypothetical protein